MRKNLTIIVLVLSIILQLSVPVGMIAYSKNIEGALPQYGKEFKVKVDVIDIYDGSIGYRAEGYYNWYDIGYYATVKADDDGYANLFSNVDKSKPETDDYIRVTMDNKAKLADFKIDSDITAWRIEEETAYIVINVYKGEFEVLGLYLDGIPAEEWFATAITEQTEYDSLTIMRLQDEEIQW